jgi:hypothetical protein
MKEQPILHDERTVTIENASYRLGYMVLSYGLLFIVAFRAFFHNESSWDLMALIILTGLATTVYQGFHRILSGRQAYLFAMTAVIAAVAAIGITVLRK